MKAGRNDIYEAVIRRMVQESIAAKNQAFAEEHEADSDEQLFAYLRACAARLGHSPHPKEIIGGQMIEARFGSWQTALRQAGLRQPWTANKPSKFTLMIEEDQFQRQLYREKKAQKKQLAEQRKRQQAEKRRQRENQT